MQKWIFRLLKFGVPSLMIIKAMLSTGSMTDLGLLIVGVIWLCLAVIFKFEGTSGGMGATTRADIEYKNSKAEMRGGFFSGRSVGDD